ncbi:MAG: hypothetical protein RLZZ488_2774 [Pseudomonadota bacterium]|jgi:methylthioribulose-1-phosphate dehydratase
MRVERRYRFDASGQMPLSLFEQIKLGQLCEVAVRLDSRHAIPATSSNFSIRRDDSAFFVSRSGKHKRALNPSDFLLVDLHGRAKAPVAPKPSDETLLHAVIYKNCPWIECVIHCHAPELEFLRAPSFTVEGHELLKALGASDHLTPLDLRVYENTQDMAELASGVESRQLTGDGTRGAVTFVLARHGIYCGGENIGKTEAYLEALLHLLKLQQT